MKMDELMDFMILCSFTYNKFKGLARIKLTNGFCVCMGNNCVII